MSRHLTFPGAVGRGVLAAMAMTGLRQVTTGVGFVEQTPPEAILAQGTPEILAPVPERYRQAAIEVAHWGYGAFGGAVWRFVPAGVRARRLAGPVYGLAHWAFFQAVVAPLLGLGISRESRPAESAALAVDHLLYGAVLASGAPD